MTDNQRWEKFPAETLRLIFSAIDKDDVVEENVSLSQNISLRDSSGDLRRNYALCLQFWKEGFSREELLELINCAIQERMLSPAESLQYKYIRARYKHLRFAQRLYSREHKCGHLFNNITIFLGHFQDAFRHQNEENLRYYGRLLRCLLSWPVWQWMNYILEHIQVDSDSGFLAYQKKQIQTLKTFVARPLLTGREFHDVRKIISQQVSYYDTLRSIDTGNLAATEISRFLAAINGLMGERHDEMVADRLAGGTSYDKPAMLDSDIRQRLERFLERSQS